MLIKIHFALIEDALWKSQRIANAFEGFCLYLFCILFNNVSGVYTYIIQQVNLAVALMHFMQSIIWLILIPWFEKNAGAAFWLLLESNQ